MVNAYAQLEQSLRQQPQRWVLTGVAGFIGSHLLQRLLELGQEVVGVDNFSTGRKDNLEAVRQAVGPRFAQNFELIEADLADFEVCRRVCQPGVRVLHQAALGSVPRSLAKPLDSHIANVDATTNLLIAATQAEVASLVFASSSSVYGDSPTLPKEESKIGDPLSPYAATKRIAEIYAQVWHRCYDLAVVGLRYFNVVGERQDPNGPYAAVVPRWLDTLLRGEAATIFGDGETSRDFCPVANVVQMNLLAAFADKDAQGRFYNVALGTQTTLNELFTILRDGLASHGIDCAKSQPIYADFRPGDIRHSLADISLAQKHLGYDPQVDISSGLAAAIASAVTEYRQKEQAKAGENTPRLAAGS